MVDQQPLLRAFGAFARTLTEPYEVGDVLYRLADDAVELLGVDAAGVAVADRDQLVSVSATEERVAVVEAAQVRTGEGPCHDAWRSGEVVRCEDLAAESRWPAYAPVALEVGFRAVVGIPMHSRGTGIGALNLYVDAPRRWERETIELAGILADAATGAIVNARALDEARQLNDQLRHALDSRVVIEQAKGILAERHGLPTAEAFERLRGLARSTNTRIHDLAAAVVAGHADLDGHAPPGARR